MGYERIARPDGPVYHYTKRENLSAILSDGRIRRMGDTECWVCGSLGFYPKFVPEDYVILKLKPRYQSGEWVRWNQEMPPGCPPGLIEAAREFSRLKLGYRGDLKFREHPEVIEVALLISGQSHQQTLTM